MIGERCDKGKKVIKIGKNERGLGQAKTEKVTIGEMIGKMGIFGVR